VRYRAATTLGAWADRRVLSYSLSLLRDDDPDTHAEACSVVWRFRLPEVAGAIYEQALHDDSAEETENATSVLMDFQDPRCGELNLAPLQHEDSNESNLGGAGIAATLEPGILAREMSQDICDLLAGWLDPKPAGIRLVARCALLNMHDTPGYQGVWQDLKETADVSKGLSLLCASTACDVAAS